MKLALIKDPTSPQSLREVLEFAQKNIGPSSDDIVEYKKQLASFNKKDVPTSYYNLLDMVKDVSTSGPAPRGGGGEKEPPVNNLATYLFTMMAFQDAKHGLRCRYAFLSQIYNY